MGFRIGGHALPDLRVVELARVEPHEDFDERRIVALAERVQRDGIVRNPPIVAPLGDGRYVVLDGANRVSALKYLEYRDVIVQVVDYHEVGLSGWNHLVVGFAEDLLETFAALPGLAPRPATLADARAALAAGTALAFASGPGGRTQAYGGAADLAGRAALQVAMVEAYNGLADIHRVKQDDFAALESVYEDASGLVVFPAYRPDDVLALVREGGRLPSGVSRHVIPDRALRVNYALRELAEEVPRDEKNRRLELWTRRKLQAHEIRYYEEPTVLYDE